MSKASATIDLNSLKVAGENASGYITHVDEETGIQLHDKNDEDNYVQINSKEISLYQDSTPLLSLATEGVTVGDISSGHITVSSDSIGFFQDNSTEVISINAEETSLRMSSFTWVATEDRLTLWG